MRRLIQTYWAAGLALAVAVGGTAGGVQADPLSDVRPAIFVVLDTSGAMEWTATAPSPTAPDPVPDCPEIPPEGHIYLKNRWLYAAEALTGTFIDRACSYDNREDDTREDFGWTYPTYDAEGVFVADVPYRHVVWTQGGQESDGVLDTLRDDFAFGLFTLDTNPAADTDAVGDFSYFQSTPEGLDDGNPADLGVENETSARGGFLLPPSTDNLVDLHAANDAVQARVLATLPHRARPIGAALHDIAELLENDSRMQPYDPAVNPNGDPYAACRLRRVVLIATGPPTDDGGYGYPTAAEAAQRLWVEHGVRTVVVAYLVSDAADLEALNTVAFFGGTERAHIATPGHLRHVLTAVIAKRQSSIETMAKPAVTNQTGSTTIDNKQYRFYAGRRGIVDNDIDRQGVLEQEIWGCGVGCMGEDGWASAGVCGVFDIAAALNARGDDRVIKTTTADPTTAGSFSVETLHADNAAVTAAHLGIQPGEPDYPHVAMFFDGLGFVLPFGHTLTEMDPVPADLEAEYRTQLIGYIRADADSRRASARLGAIFRSTPAVAGPPRPFYYSLPSYSLYATTWADRPTVLYTATHDGLLHAFRVDRPEGLPTAQWGRELWAFMPAFARRQVTALSSNFVQLLDGPPVVRDILPVRSDPNEDPVAQAARWRTLLVAAAGPEGSGVFALDVTNPAAWSDSTFLWELSSEGRCEGPGPGTCFPGLGLADGGHPTDANSFPRLGSGRPSPVIGTLFFDNGSGAAERAVVLISGGDDVASSGRGAVFYVVDAFTGAKVVEFSADSGNVVDGTLDAPITSAPAAYLTLGDEYISRVFVGDAKGRIWRIAFDSTSPSDWRMRLFFDTYDGLALDSPVRAPVRETPTVLPTPNTFGATVLYTAGDWESQSAETIHYVVSLQEDTATAPVAAVENWRLPFATGEVALGGIEVFDAVAYFTSYLLPDDLCQIGTARLWGAHAHEGDAGGPKGMLSRDGSLVQGFDDRELYFEYEDVSPNGVTVLTEPSCDLDNAYLDGPLPTSRFSASGGPASGGRPIGAGTTRVVMARTRTSQASGSPTGGTASPDGSAGAELSVGVGTPTATAVRVFVRSWAVVFQ